MSLSRDNIVQLTVHAPGLTRDQVGSCVKCFHDKNEEEDFLAKLNSWKNVALKATFQKSCKIGSKPFRYKKLKMQRKVQGRSTQNATFSPRIIHHH